MNALSSKNVIAHVNLFLDVQAEVSQRLSNAKEATNRNVSVQSHEDLARKLQVS